MTDKMFMSMLDSASKKKLTPINFASFMHILIQGYSEDLGLLGLYAVENGCTMILTAGTPDRKILNFLTNREYYYKLKRNIPPSNREKVNAQLFSCRRIINNVLDNESIAGICFNAIENNHVTVEKEILTAYIQEGMLVKITDQ